MIRDMTRGPAARLILKTALPLMLGNVFQQLYTLVDASVVGRGIGLTALAALGSAEWFNWLFISIAQGLAQGFSIPIAQTFGAKDLDGARRYAGSAASLGLFSAAAITALALLSIGPVLGWMGTPVEVRPMAGAYLAVLFSGLPIVMGYNLLAGMLRALGDSHTPLMAMTLSSLVNIALDALFVLVLRWGVWSAAAATLIAEAVSCAFCLARLRRVPFMRVRRSDLTPDRQRWRRLLRLGAPVSAQNAIIAVGGMIVQAVVNGMGVAFIAGYTATNKLYGLLEMAAISYGYAISTYMGQNLGAQRMDRVRQGLRAGLMTGLVTALGITALMLTCGRLFIGMFIDESSLSARAMEVALEYLRIMAWCLPILYALHVYRSALQGMGNTLMPMVSGVAEFVMRTGSALLLPGVIGHSGVFWAEVLAWLGADCILMPSYYAMLRRPEAISKYRVAADDGGGDSFEKDSE